jgi:hypothetical protein
MDGLFFDPVSAEEVQVAHEIEVQGERDLGWVFSFLITDSGLGFPPDEAASLDAFKYASQYPMPRSFRQRSTGIATQRSLSSSSVDFCRPRTARAP